MLASERNGTLYVGVTSDIANRVWQHRDDVVKGFTSRYGVHKLVWFEFHEAITEAIAREKRLKKWNRDWKLRMIEKANPLSKDLWEDIL